MTSTIQAIQSHIATIHNEMGILWEWVQDRDTRIAALQQHVQALIEQQKALCEERDELLQQRMELRNHATLVKADRDTLATILLPLLDNGEIEAELNAARLLAVLFLSTDDRTHAWQLIQKATRHADQVNALAQRLIPLLKQECARQSQNGLRGKTDEFTALAAQIHDPHLRNQLQSALDSMLERRRTRPYAQQKTQPQQQRCQHTAHHGHSNGNGNGNGKLNGTSLNNGKSIQYSSSVRERR